MKNLYQTARRFLNCICSSNTNFHIILSILFILTSLTSLASLTRLYNLSRLSSLSILASLIRLSRLLNKHILSFQQGSSISIKRIILGYNKRLSICYRSRSIKIINSIIFINLSISDSSILKDSHQIISRNNISYFSFLKYFRTII
ncbi:hypothetical protein IMG5_060250 [Ichthyophthirius multifiliis]|uniref:Transmembrane protein n=1 Tax=Ichthyophthirius multifiliis TaxID=5932 RepID=G0QNN2_ICHMU|nr:hypothetical protein IMG5_060250 [Ichthyophthirius multifiliis]EGR33169.1 hypothetical protein IMG5_060250 [Ichthyophthirius multifiliis]|eukprot:XP_004037155.1 hypothetical protein IMG5_060250 [Ichthyophthirius multifiliis]